GGSDAAVCKITRKIILFDCKRASATNDSDRSELTFCSLSFEREVNAFLKAADGAAVVSRKRSARVDVVTCKSVLHGQKRVTTPCILVTKKSEKGLSFQYSLLTLSSSNRLESCMEFKLPYQMKEGVSVLQGPTVVWSHAGDVFHVSLQTGEVRQMPVQMSHCVIGELPLHKEQIFVLGLQNLPGQSSNTHSTSQSRGYFVESGQVFDGNMMLPPPYVCIARCILVLSAEQVGDVVTSTVVVATSNQQLVFFESGILKDVCQLPFEQPEHIQLVNTGRNGCLLVISFHQGNVCALWKETFQIASHWSSVSSVHVDDFLGCGTDQMLLVFKDCGITEQPLQTFLLTDLCGISYSVRNIFFARSVQEGLTALWDCGGDDDDDDDESIYEKIQDTPAVSSKPQVDKLWHRIAEDASLSILTETGQSSTPEVIQAQSQVFWLPEPCSSSSSYSSSLSSPCIISEPAAKRSKQHNAGGPNELNTCRLAVTAVTRLTPLLNSGCVKCRVVLHYVPRQDAFSVVSNPTPVVLHCGQVALDIHSNVQTPLLKKPELKTDDAEEDLLSLMALLDRWVFHIDSPDHSLGDIDGWIHKIAGCRRIEVSPQYLLLDCSGPSALMLLRWHQITPFQGELSLQTLLFLDSLLAYLPTSCTIQSVKGTRGQGAAQIFSLALEKELVSLRESVSLCREVFQGDVERSKMRLSPLVDVVRYRRLTRNMSKVHRGTVCVMNKSNTMTIEQGGY
uniref:FA complementation group B n=1 Tax=Cyclopterus lumpus TaxID=8103 RepID=A0A8C2ZUV9_CYCLU